MVIFDTFNMASETETEITVTDEQIDGSRNLDPSILGSTNGRFLCI